jgi:hypothetical protein
VASIKKRAGIVSAMKKSDLQAAYEAGQLFGNYVTFEEYYNELLNTNKDEDNSTAIKH